ncbi:Hpt domain-containing protein [Kordiimonas sp. SCSIO 12603]|uniref:Hpt domain-containing protein n=1 Tax=Kordiimonas sp. SCSIO 12603 TaxID=2829596 RepID=UPI0021062E49|nr:Hpt domain-containing protein [Kordiimonas sp. SCSIO 12603]UTW58678.1 Hpt domain-containing protein [Kordiimonas sp. SCSIO 12603]
MGDTYPVFDESVFERMKSDVGDDVALMLLGSLQGEIGKGAVALRQHFIAQDYHMLENQAHALKSAVRSFGAMKLGEACLELEMAGKENRSWSELEQLLNDFESVSDETLSALKL